MGIKSDADINYLRTNEDKILVMPNLIHKESGVVVLSIYQDKYIQAWFQKYYGEELHYQGQIYFLKYCLNDVVKYHKEKIKKLFDNVVKGLIVFSEGQLLETCRQDAMLPEEYGPKAIILVLSEKES